jgi:excisionase family DNA binding protein
MGNVKREVSPTVEVDEFLTVREVASLLKVSEVRVYHLCEEELPAFRIGRSVRVRCSDREDFIAEQLR